MKKQSKRIVLAAGLLAVALLVATGVLFSQTYTFTVVQGDSFETVTCRFGTHYAGEVLVYTQAGDVRRYAEGYRVTEQLTGIILEPPQYVNADVYAMAHEQLSQGNKVMILYLDGFGWQTYQYVREQELIPNLSKLSARCAAAMYPTITPVNYAAIVSGKAPGDTGVTARGIHTLLCDTIFDATKSMGLHAYIAEGDAQILNFNVPQELNPDMDMDGDTDTEVLQSAYAGMADSDLLLVHLHGIDDAGHAYGPRSQEALNKIAQTDAWVGELLDAWPGRVIVVADHGQHDNDGTGDAAYAEKRGVHGSFAPSDLYVPILTNY